MRISFLSLSLLWICSLPAQIPDFVPSEGLIAYYPCNGDLLDFGPSAHHGTLAGPIPAADRFGNASHALSFDGIDDQGSINSSSSWNYTNGFSIGFWIKLNSLPPSDEAIIYAHQLNSSVNAIGLVFSYSSTGKLNFRMGNGSPSSYSGLLDNPISMGTWHHIVGQYGNDTQELYIDGLLINSISQPDAVAGNNGVAMQLGAATWEADNTYSMDGIIDNLAIWNQNLSSIQITNLFTEYECPSVNITYSIPQIPVFGESLSLVSESLDNTFTYSWQTSVAGIDWTYFSDNPTYSGTTSNALTISPISSANHGQLFRILAENENCSVVSEPYIISIPNACEPFPIAGCTYPGAYNYNANATLDDGTCAFPYSALPADLDVNGLVNISDLLIFTTYFGSSWQ